MLSEVVSLIAWIYIFIYNHFIRVDKSILKSQFGFVFLFLFVASEEN